MKKVFVYIIGLVISHVPLPQKFCDFLMWPLATRILGKGYKQKVYLKDGFWMHGGMEDILTRDILFLGRWKSNLWEPETCKALETILNSSKEIIVAGSHIGYMVLKAAEASQGRIHAFEPVPHLYKLSKENFSLNPKLDRKIILNKEALGEENGEIDFYMEDIRSSAIAYSGSHVKNKNLIKVKVITIDDYARKLQIQKFDLILLDIEGFEWFALNGAEFVLRKHPKLILEISPRILAHTKIRPEMLTERLSTLGYKIEYLDKSDDYANIYATKSENI